MVALSFLSDRLAPPPVHFLERGHPAWTRLEVDMRPRRRRVAGGGRWLSDRSSMRPIDASSAPTSCAAWPRRWRGCDRARSDRSGVGGCAAVRGPRASEADAALARYWLAYGLYQSDNELDARSLLQALLEQVRAGLSVEPDFEMRAADGARRRRVARRASIPRPLVSRRGARHGRPTSTIGDARRSSSTWRSATARPATSRRRSAPGRRDGPLPRRRSALRVGADRERPRPGVSPRPAMSTAPGSWPTTRRRRSRTPATSAGWRR